MKTEIQKIKISKVSYETEFCNSCLEFNISGENINNSIMNALRRTVYTSIPIYAFDNFDFGKNTSIYHNNYIKAQIENIPVLGIENNIDFKKEDADIDLSNIHETKDENIKSDEYDDLNDTKQTITLNTNNLTMYVHYKNDSEELLTISTNEAKFYYKNKQITSPYIIPISIIKLKPTQEILFTCISNLNTEHNNAKYSAVSVAHFKENSITDYNFILESRGQINEIRIINVALINIENAFNRLKESINDNDELNNHLNGEIIIENEDHSFIYIIVTIIQQYKNVSFAGYNIIHPLDNKTKIHYEIKNGNIKEIIIQAIETAIKIYASIKKEFNDIYI